MLNAHNDTDIDVEDKPLTDMINGKGTIQRKPLSTVDVMAQVIWTDRINVAIFGTLLLFRCQFLKMIAPDCMS